MEFRILGPLEVLQGDEVVTPPALKLRALLALFLLHANQPIQADVLVDQLWGEAAPGAAAKTLQSYLSNLRRLLGEGRPGSARAASIVTQPAGYILRLEEEALDARRFDRLAREGEALCAPQGRHESEWTAYEATDARSLERALARFDEALALWRGPALADLTHEDFARPHIERLAEQRLAVIEDRVSVALALGRHAMVTGDLEELVGQHPYRERLRGLLMLGLYRSGRQVEALAAYMSLVHTLGQELGITPGPPLRHLHGAILRHDPRLDWRTAGALGKSGLVGALPTRYVRSRGVSIAYQVMGEGPDLVCVPGGISHLDLDLELAKPRRFYDRLATSFRVIRFDKPNTGLSDRDERVSSLDDRIDDLWALLAHCLPAYESQRWWCTPPATAWSM